MAKVRDASLKRAIDAIAQGSPQSVIQAWVGHEWDKPGNDDNG